MAKKTSLLTTISKTTTVKITTTTKKNTFSIITSTVNILYICQSYTGLRLNATALSQLVFIGSFNYSLTTSSGADLCCYKCNSNPNCDYSFESKLGTGINNCLFYHWKISDGYNRNQLTDDIKQGLWFQSKPYGMNSGMLIFSYNFIRYF